MAKSEFFNNLIIVFGMIICGASITISLKYQDDFVVKYGGTNK